MTLEKKYSISFICPFAFPLLSGEKVSAAAGGAEHQLVLFGAMLKKNNWEVSFIVSRPEPGSANRTLLPVHFADFSYLGGSKRRILNSWISLLQAMAKADAECYCLKLPGHLLAPASIFCKIRKRKLIFWAQKAVDSLPHERIKTDGIASRMMDWGLRRADVVIAQTSQQRKEFKENYGIEAYVVPNIYVNSEQLQAVSPDAQNAVDILWVGNSLANKRQEIVLELARLMPNRNFAIAMNKIDKTRFAAAQETAEKLKNIVFLGALTQEEVQQWFKKTKLFLNTSLREGFPNTFLQAWASGVPVVSLNVDPDNVIEQHKLGKVVEKNIAERTNFPQKAELLIGPVEELLKEERLRREMGEAAFSYVMAHHAPDKVTKKLTDILEGVISKRQNKQTGCSKKKIIIISEKLSCCCDEGVAGIAWHLADSLNEKYGLRLITTVKKHNISNIPVEALRLNRLFLNNKLKTLLNSYSPDIIFYVPANSGSFFSFFRAKVLKLFCRKSKIVLISAQFVKYLPWQKVILRFFRPDSLLLLSSLSEKFFSKIIPNVKTLPPAVDNGKFHKVSDDVKSNLRKKYNLPLDKVIVSHVGHVKTNRSLEVFIQVQKLSQVQVVIAAGPSVGSDKKLKQRLQNEGIIILEEYLPRIEEIYQLSDFYVFPVLKNNAGAIDMPLSVMEAMACNIPVIATRFGALTDFFKQGKGFEYFDKTEELIMLLENPLKSEIENDKKISGLNWDKFAEETIKASEGKI